MVAVNQEMCAEGLLEIEGLEGRQRRFVQEYCKDLNGTRAAIRAGYSHRGAHVQGVRLLRNDKVRYAVERFQVEAARGAKVTAQEVLENIRQCGKLAEAKGDYSTALKALELLGKHLGLFRGVKAKDAGPSKLSINLTTEQS
ncbi:MAG TPA: terminase small subunit [Nitrospirae bacterium]|nr:terminase small subunit [Nitrospirota bacterium]